MVRAVLCDMDGVLYRGSRPIPGATAFVEWLLSHDFPFLFLTNNSEYTRAGLSGRMAGMDFPQVPERRFLTSAMVAAAFVASQQPGARVYCVGAEGLKSELAAAGLILCEDDADYVVAGRTPDFDYSMLKKASGLITQGARFVGTNPDVSDPCEDGIEPAAGSILAAIQAATGRAPYITGKPNPLMLLSAKRILGAHAHETLLAGDRMDTDVLSAIEAGMQSCLVLSGIARREDAVRYPYRPDMIIDHAGLLPGILIPNPLKEA